MAKTTQKSTRKPLRSREKLTEQVHVILKEQNEIFIDRHDALLYAWATGVAGVNCFYLGVKGVSKSMLVTDMVRRIVGARRFEYLVKTDSTSSELFGPPKLSMLAQDRYVINTDGRLAGVHFAFLDEIWKASSAATNPILTAINEKVFDNDGQRQPIPLISVYAASNEIPLGQDSAPLYDRFLVRMVVGDLENDSDFYELLRRDTGLPNTYSTIELSDFYALMQWARYIQFPEDLKQKIVEIRARLKTEHGLRFSPRRWKEGMKVVRALALLRGHDLVLDEDLEAYQYMLWDSPEQQPKARKVVLSVANPLGERLIELVDGIEGKYHEIRTAHEAGVEDVQLTSLAVNAVSACKKALQDLDAIEQQASGSVVDRVGVARKRVEDVQRYVLNQVMKVRTDARI